MKVRASIMDITPYAGGDAGLPGEEKVYRMASNESALGPSPKAIEAFMKAGPDLHRYPDGHAKALRQAIARGLDIEAERIVCGSGSDELLHLLVQAYAGQGDEVLFSRHGFLVYRIAAQINGALPVEAPEKNLCADIDALVRLVSPKTKIVFIANPNNPTGSHLSGKDLRDLRARLRPDILLAIDAAYAEYANADEYDSGLELARESENVVMLRTFSKIYGLAGLRVGWAYCPPAVADVLNRIRGPFNCSAPAQEAAIAALQDREHLAKAKAHNDYWLPWFRKRLEEIGLKAYPSQGNFVLIEFPQDPQLNADRAASFLSERRVLVRKMGAYHLPHCLRITIAEEEALKKAIEGLAEFVANAGSQ